MALLAAVIAQTVVAIPLPNGDHKHGSNTNGATNTPSSLSTQAQVQTQAPAEGQASSSTGNHNHHYWDQHIPPQNHELLSVPDMPRPNSPPRGLTVNTSVVHHSEFTVVPPQSPTGPYFSPVSPEEYLPHSHQVEEQ
ncbi:hypothetical protein FRC17_004447 [Serendipita sp. 399]|nr:hypothetical protein FRC17_004447 [Serendipita sp. 399]